MRLRSAKRVLVHRPHILEIVIGTNLRPKQVNDHIARIHQNPVALRKAFDARCPVAGFLQPPGKMLRRRSDVALRSAGSDDDRIA